MPNYYEILKVAPTAETAELESLLDARYEQWSNLVTHQDPKLQIQAQQALQVIEQMRTTLLDPVRRQGYDEAIGVAGAVGGLVDPDVVLQMPAGMGAPMTPYTPPAPTATQAPAQPMGPGLWACSRGHENPADTRYCLRCGEELVRTCPECGQLKSLHSTGLCGNCGYKYEVAWERKALSERILALSGEVSGIQSALADASSVQPFGCLSVTFALGAVMAIAWGFVFSLEVNTTGGLLGVLAGGVVLVIVILHDREAGAKKNRMVSNLTAELASKERELAIVQQRHTELSLRRTGDE